MKLDIIYQYQLKQDELIEENERLSKELEDRRIRVREAGNIAKAALEIHDVMQAAQAAAEHYLEEMKLRCDEEMQRILDEAKAEAAAIIVKAREEADKNS